MTAELKVQSDSNLQRAGECFMFLLWVESTMIDFLTLEAGDSVMRNGYNSAYRSGSAFPKDFATSRLELSRKTFEEVKGIFLKKWPQWKNDGEVHSAIERMVIFRNAIGHAQVQPFRPYLLYTPHGQKALDRIYTYMHCAGCGQLLKNCGCKKKEDLASPRTMKLSFSDRKFVAGLYGDIRTVDGKCFFSTSKLLNVAYQGIAWPLPNGKFHLRRNNLN